MHRNTKMAGQLFRSEGDGSVACWFQVQIGAGAFMGTSKTLSCS
jgi:hypothetical protein